MPFGKSLGGSSAMKLMTVRQTDLGGGQLRLEMDYVGEVSGEAPGNHYGTYTMVASGDPASPIPYSYTGTTLLASGAVLGVTGAGFAQRTGEGHKMRLRGMMRYAPSSDPKLAAFNNMIAAIESELDPATNTIKGSGWEWK